MAAKLIRENCNVKKVKGNEGQEIRSNMMV